MSQGDRVDDILLDEIRLNRKAIAKLDEKFTSKITELDKEVFSNKIKLTLFIAGLSIFFNIIVIVIAEKLKAYFIA